MQPSYRLKGTKLNLPSVNKLRPEDVICWLIPILLLSYSLLISMRPLVVVRYTCAKD